MEYTFYEVTWFLALFVIPYFLYSYILLSSFLLAIIYLVNYIHLNIAKDIDFKGTGVLITGCDSGNISSPLSGLSRRQTNDIFFIFPRKQDLTFHSNWRQFA